MVHKPYVGKGPRICGLTAGEKFGMFAQTGSEPLTFLTASFNAAIAQANNDDSAFGQGADGCGKRFAAALSLVYRHGQRYGLIPRRYESNPMCFVRCKTTSGYEAMIITPEQAYAIVRNLLDPERTLTLLAAGTGLRISECLGLQWQDVSFADAMIHVRRTWTCGQVGLPKTKASKGPVPLHLLLAEFMICWKRTTPYPKPLDWVFPSLRLNGKQPRVANMLVEDYLRPAAVKAGILSSHRDDHGRLVDDDPRRFGFHNLRHSLASFLIRIRTDPKTVQTLLRHSDVKLTLQFYGHAVSQDRMAAAGAMLCAILSHAADESGLRAD